MTVAELIDRLRAMPPDLPVLVCSYYQDGPPAFPTRVEVIDVGRASPSDDLFTLPPGPGDAVVRGVFISDRIAPEGGTR